MTYNDLVVEVFPNATTEDCEKLLWYCKAFPFCDVEHTKRQLKEIYERSGGNVSVAIALAHDDIDTAITEAHQSEINAAMDINLSYDYNKDIYLLWLKNIPHGINHWEMRRLNELCQQAYLIKNKEAL
jgi:hypothetical protein